MMKVEYLEVLNKVNVFKDLSYIDVSFDKSKFRLFPSETIKNRIMINSCLGVKIGIQMNFIAFFKKSKESVSLKGKLKVASSDMDSQVNLFSNESVLCGIIKIVFFGH